MCELSRLFGCDHKSQLFEFVVQRIVMLMAPLMPMAYFIGHGLRSLAWELNFPWNCSSNLRIPLHFGNYWALHCHKTYFELAGAKRWFFSASLCHLFCSIVWSCLQKQHRGRLLKLSPVGVTRLYYRLYLSESPVSACKSLYTRGFSICRSGALFSGGI